MMCRYAMITPVSAQLQILWKVKIILEMIVYHNIAAYYDYPITELTIILG